MKISQTIVAFVTYLAFTNIAFTTPLTSKTDYLDLLAGDFGDVAASNKVSTNAEGNLRKRQSKQELHAILRDMDHVISNLGATNREEFLNELINQLFYNNGHYNYVVCHVAHNYNFEGTEGVDWAHYETKFQKYDYDIVIGKAGVFTRYGDGSSVNWAYSTAYVKDVTSGADNSMLVIFAEPF